MRLVSYWLDGALRPAFEDAGRVVDAESVHRFAGEPTVRRLLEAGPDALAAAATAAGAAMLRGSDPVRELDGLRLGPPLPDPDKILCLGFNYAEHATELSEDVPVAPNVFAKFRNALVGPADPIVLTAASTEIDYEAELAAVIGQRCRDVSERDALGYVAGYAAFNDVSARDLQFRTSQFTVGKALDTFAPMGPGITLSAEVGDPQALRVRSRLNGTVMQDGTTAQMVFSVAATIAFLSRVMTLEPGDIIATGTPPGVGYKRTPPVYLRAGDTIEVEVERVGRIRNPVAAPRVAAPRARPS
ncbi:MAG: fumarylacetoacetate hydrolase family protein [Chloroflexi bacterium]|nr:fumarylacetoacetate hydrolase family protein [Chloroflexota bacterium]